jgi:hypothetical protein
MAEIVRFDYPVAEVMADIVDNCVPGIKPDVYRCGTRDLKHLQWCLEEPVDCGDPGTDM